MTCRFLCDEMLAGLGRWLRAAGFDTAQAPRGTADGLLLVLAAGEGRLFLTRDRAVMQHRAARSGVMVLEGEGMDAWAAELRHRAGLDWTHRPFSRCLLCNQALEPAAPETALALPEAVRAAGPVLWCAGCGKAYWRGGHVRRMRSRLERWAAGG